MEPLCDPCGDRAMKDIVPPPHRPLSDDLLYPNKCMLLDSFFLTVKFIASNAPNWELLKNHLYREGRITKEHCSRILRDTLNVISNHNFILIYHSEKEPNLLSLHDPVTVVGDIHG